MEKVLTLIKEVCQYVGIVLLACGAVVWMIFTKKSKI